MSEVFAKVLNVRSVVLMVALYNFLLIYWMANRWSLDCMLCPWYVEWSFSNAPSVILLAALALRVGRRDGSFLALVASGVIVVRGLGHNFELMQYGGWLDSWRPLAIFQMNPFLSLHTQYSFALFIFIMSAFMARKMLRHTGIQQALDADSP